MRYFCKFIAITTILSLFLLILIENSFSQSKNRKLQTKKVQSTNNTPYSSAISHFIKGMQTQDYRAIIDSLYYSELNIAAIKGKNPQVLWERKINEFYEGMTNKLTQIINPSEDASRNVEEIYNVNLMRDFGSLFFLFPKNCNWSISEVRDANTLNSVAEGQKLVYVTINYPLDKTVPRVSDHFLKQIILLFTFLPGTQTIVNIFMVEGTVIFWQKPYPKSATDFLINKYKSDLIKSDYYQNYQYSISQLTELAGIEETKRYALEVFKQQTPYTYPFNNSVEFLSNNKVKEIVPFIINALRGRYPTTIKSGYDLDKIYSDDKLVRALKNVGRNDFPESITILLNRLNTILPRLEDKTINLNLEALASVDDEIWLSFPYRNLANIVVDINRNQRNSRFIDNNSPNINGVINFLNNLKPCSVNKFFRCPSDLTYSSVNILDAKTVELYGRIDEEVKTFNYHKVGDFKMVLARTNQQPDVWLVQEITRN